MHVFVSKKPLSPVRWHEAFPRAVTVRTPAEVRSVLRGDGVIWLDFTGISPTERAAWLVKAKQLGSPFIVLSNVPMMMKLCGSLALEGPAIAMFSRRRSSCRRLR